GRLAAQPRDPPAVALRPVRLPVVDRVAPALAGGTEVVRRDAAHPGAAAVGLEREELAMRPDVGAVAGDEDRRIADHPDAAAPGVGMQPGPWAPGDRRAERPEADLLAAAGAAGGERRRVALAQSPRPVLPVPAGPGLGDRHEAGVVVEPVGLGDAEG